MAMVKCTECSAEISSTATSCPKCGGKQRRTSPLVKLLAAAIAIGGVAALMAGNSADERKAAAEAAKPPGQRASEAAQAKREEAEFQAAVHVAKALKASQKNPASFQLELATLTEAGALCISYRSANSFNAIVPGYAVVPAKGKPVAGDMSDVHRVWLRECSDKRGRSMTHIKAAL